MESFGRCAAMAGIGATAAHSQSSAALRARKAPASYAPETSPLKSRPSATASNTRPDGFDGAVRRGDNDVQEAKRNSDPDRPVQAQEGQIPASNCRPVHQILARKIQTKNALISAGNAKMSVNTSTYTLICFPCRYTTKADWVRHRSRRCPTCRNGLENVGKNFVVPKKYDDKGWASSEAYFRRMCRTTADYEAEGAYNLAKAWAARRHE